jgi:peptide/nickel transport system permease protein
MQQSIPASSTIEVPAEARAGVRGRSPLGAAVHRLLANRVARGGLIIIATFGLMAILSPVLLPYNPQLDSDLLARLKPPSWAHPFGTDALGRDILMRILHGARVSLGLGVSSVVLAGLIGSVLGLLAGYAGRRIDLCVMFCMDILLAFPATLLAIAIVAMIGPGLRNALIAISVVSIPFYARITRGEVLSLKEREFVTAARGLGGSARRIVLWHIFPNTLPPLAVQTTLAIAFAVLEAAALGFLGLGAQPPTPEWGAMLADSYKFFTSGAWWAFFFPGAAIMLSVLGFNLVGDALRDALDPRLRV